jgi:hypothetical protein
MKKYIRFLTVFFVLPFITNGCYTILWTPEDDFPDESNYGYYDSYYYDEYHYYYDYPWWLSFTSPVYSDEDQSYERDKSTTTIRNNGNGRGDSGLRNEIINTPPPTRSNTPPSTGSDNSSGTSSTKTRTESVDSNNNSRQGSNSNSGNVRNNDGNRNNGRGR